MAWKLVLAKHALRALDRLPASEQQHIREALEKLRSDPGSVDLAKLSGPRARWRVRVGPLRIIVGMSNIDGTIYVLDVIQRKDAYR